MAMPAFALGVADGIRTGLSVFICFTNRCGSNFLADLLAATGKLPRAGKYFNAPTVIDRASRAGIAGFDAYCHLLHEKQAQDGHLLAKAGIEQLAMLARRGYFGTLFPKPHLIHVHRYDVVAQAVSFLLTRHTGQWIAGRENTAAGEGAQYDRMKIAAHIERVGLENVMIRQSLQVNRLRHLPVQYEHLAATPDRTVAMIAEWLGLGSVAIDPKRLKVARQASDLTRQFHDRYLSEMAQAGIEPSG